MPDTARKLPPDMDAVFAAIAAEVTRARTYYPTWQQDPIHAAAVMMEEAGEVLKACNDLVWHERGDVQEIRKELVQTGAMVVRMLLDTEALR